MNVFWALASAPSGMDTVGMCSGRGPLTSEVNCPTTVWNITISDEFLWVNDGSVSMLASRDKTL